MTNEWRPAGWEGMKFDGYKACGLEREYAGIISLPTDNERIAFEAGASAMLTGIREKAGYSKSQAASGGVVPEYPDAWYNGKWVFIPDNPTSGPTS